MEWISALLPFDILQKDLLEAYLNQMLEEGKLLEQIEKESIYNMSLVGEYYFYKENQSYTNNQQEELNQSVQIRTEVYKCYFKGLQMIK